MRKALDVKEVRAAERGEKLTLVVRFEADRAMLLLSRFEPDLGEALNLAVREPVACDHGLELEGAPGDS